MLFTSFEFLIWFLPIAVIGYYILPFKWQLKNLWLLSLSLFFYAWGEPRFIWCLIGSIAVNYVAALYVLKHRLVLLATVAANLLLLFVFKYLNFVTGGLTHVMLPMGISFFTFQAISYVVDVYRGQPAQRNPFLVALYIAFFPRLLAGPIVRYGSICQQLYCRKVSSDVFSDGFFRFLMGFNKKMLLANVFAAAADKAFGISAPDASMAWLGAICYTFQIFFDFSGYSDMAIGLGRMFGFEFQENFDHPYISNSASEFWRRWHISLGQWFRDYVYFPLGGSRVASKWRLILNLSVVWLATGIWHGANWTFILWGVFWGILIIGEKLAKFDLTWPLTMLAAIVGWVLFRSPDIASAGQFLLSMCGHNGWTSTESVFEWREMLVAMFAGTIFSTDLMTRFSKTIIADILQLALFVVSISSMVMNTHNPFVYLNF